jgi:hypothetical protein
LKFYFHRYTGNTAAPYDSTNQESTDEDLFAAKEWKQAVHKFTVTKIGTTYFYWFSRTMPAQSAVDISEIMCYESAGSTDNYVPRSSPITSTNSVLDLTRYYSWPYATLTSNNLVYNTDNTFSFNGTNSYIDCGNPVSTQLTKAVTMEAWVKPTSSSGLGNIICKNQNAGYRMRIQNGALWCHTNGVAAASAGTACPNGVWVHCVATMGPSGYKVYVNGVLSGSTATAWSPPDTVNGNLYLGCYAPSSETFDGTIAVARIYSKELSATEIQQNFNAQRSRYGI